MFDAFRARIIGANRILLISHVAPDGDAIGSLLALKWLLEQAGKSVVAANADDVPEPLHFLPGWESIVRAADQVAFDLIIGLDSSDLARLGTAFQPERHRHLPLINIDHHVTNLNYGTVNIVDSQAASTTQVLFNLARALDWPISQKVAQCLLTGLVTDTRGFRTANVDAAVMGMAQDLLKTGVSLTQITENTLNRRSVASICIWGKALNAVQIEDRMIWTTIPLSMRSGCDNVANSDTGLVSFLVEAEEADVSVVFSEREDGRIDVGMRAVPGFDVSQVALSLGGGGHPLAAGCSLYTTLPAAEAQVLAVLRAALAGQRQRNDSAAAR